MYAVSDAVVISRDPFARHNVIRRTVETTAGCAWCGNRRRSGRLFQYGIDPDGGQRSWDRESFCGKTCRDAYHG